jgi:hypothetical protein
MGSGAALIAVLAIASCAGNSGGRSTGVAGSQATFRSPEEAGAAIVSAAEQFDLAAMKEILGPEGLSIVVTEDTVQSRNQATAFVAEARVQTRVERDPGDAGRAVLLVGAEDWPLPIPVVEEGGRWRFDSAAGLQEVAFRRIGRNELDAIEICRGFVEAQWEYAMERHDDAPINQYARRIISTPGKRDGLAWQAAEGTWEGPVGEEIAGAIAEGYSDRYKPYHGYYFKVLTGQGPAAPMGEMDFVIRGFMIGGFALVAAPADYSVTGVKTFIVSHDGIVFEKDFGPGTLEEFRRMERYNPDSTWSPLPEE